MKKKNSETEFAKYYEDTDFSSLIKKSDVKIMGLQDIVWVTKVFPSFSA